MNSLWENRVAIGFTDKPLESVLDAVSTTAKGFIMSMFIFPLWMIYLHGPSLLGFWNGRPYMDICSSMTNRPSSHWEKNPEECIATIEQHFNMIMVPVSMIIWMVLCIALCYKFSNFLLTQTLTIVAKAATYTGRKAIVSPLRRRLTYRRSPVRLSPKLLALRTTPPLHHASSRKHPSEIIEEHRK